MKRIIAIALLLTMALCLCACGENNKEPRYVGVWETYDKTAKLTLNENGTASLVITGENAGTYDLKWTAESVSNIVLYWAGEPVLAPVDEKKEDTAADTTEDVVAEDAADEIVDFTVADVPEEPAAADDSATATTGAVRKIDPSTVGFGSLNVSEGQLWLTFTEGSSEDILLFTYAFQKVA